MKLFFTSDIHLPLFKNEFSLSIERLCNREEEFEVAMFAGDIIDRGKIQHFSDFFSIIKKCKFKKIISIFGNDEYEEEREKVKKEYSWVIWLDDENVQLNIENYTVTVLGTTGVLDVPTKWQYKNIPNIREKYERRLVLIEKFLKAERRERELKILLTHYPPTFKTLQGELPFLWPQMGSERAERLIKDLDTLDYVIHGHAHNGKILDTKIGNTRVFNVAFPARKNIFILEIAKKVLLTDFFSKKSSS
ncbi:metallophosphoesterase family protein [Fervidicoccus fontis]|uniref:Metallophosphoesterase n=1 Tax=Fervidicoccus fontis TaxID=683846 RepID=A0A2J6N7W8_9CREN|nr:metallophosphoesterase [Fervidicoccus fontis]PMB75938.1 MAG: metallophosphoesterase [Fervidicoccus fontis]PMB77427.1 MAG: metallophosphoesterase [Fervidicoccus fontis]HEW63918.1 metallophosphoesterase [Fervidicoccus fontis]